MTDTPALTVEIVEEELAWVRDSKTQFLTIPRATYLAALHSALAGLEAGERSTSDIQIPTDFPTDNNRLSDTRRGSLTGCESSSTDDESGTGQAYKPLEAAAPDSKREEGREGWLLHAKEIGRAISRRGLVTGSKPSSTDDESGTGVTEEPLEAAAPTPPASDLVERLKALVRLPHFAECNLTVCDEAAAEILKLQDEKAALERGIEKEVYSRVERWRSAVEKTQSALTAAKQENERLREALERIDKNALGVAGDAYVKRDEVAEKFFLRISNIARAALATEGRGGS